MQPTRSSRALAGALLFAVCGPIAAFGIAVAPHGGGAPQARIINSNHQRFGRHHGNYRGPVGDLRHTGATKNA